ncbi:hypothetical protein OS493_036703 [Desmophyllum pertusum]|uniref:Decapping nuclease n=1 Tax=Desmophyllum pertusum TaxID=174260 RepID=A0A9X0D1E8_9CNID|nr:hypothetical protein OS493_036703 [Desmophyllum pertusum]
MVATRYRGTVYLSHIEEEETLNSFIQKLCYWGKRFEVEVTKSCGASSERDPAPAQATEATLFPGPSSAPPPENEVERHGPLKAYPGFYSVVRFELENHRIALRAEVDAQTQSSDEQQIPPLNYVELKVTTEASILSVSKLVHWWCQSIVSGTPLIVCGIRDKDGHVKKIEHVKTDDIPDRVGRGSLDKERYLLFLNDVLTWMKNVVREEDVVAVFRYAPGKNVTASVSPRDPQNAFLREWYVNEMEEYFVTVAKQRKPRGRKGRKRKMEA